ncbi:signal peptidase I [Streptomyces sp. NBC_01142]|uniref:signal peptidase I n=1 Tax=Streptomyces sp. NBC_01142 TaxID=2975865 RepID=UPI0022500A1A|nr:signal peptidase I [Streptomyces sp. NBC_01142]MCX4823521.1 signal peptidase I [Streptomyces sp. NBC_01142]
MRQGRGLRIAGWVLVPLGVVLGVVSFLLVKAGYITAFAAGASMEPTYSRGDRLLAEKVDSGKLRRGDVVLVSSPDRYEGYALMRIVGLGGDQVACCTDEQQVTVDGMPLSEPYLKGVSADNGYGRYSVTVPQGRVFLLGDNRGNSNDSRFFLSEHSGTFAGAQVHGRLTDDVAVPMLLMAGVPLGGVLALVGMGCGLAGWLVGRKPYRSAAAPPPFSYA